MAHWAGSSGRSWSSGRPAIRPTASSSNGSRPAIGEAAELAFAALVDRHGPLVFRACRAILGDEHDARDAFQATFLVLVRKARRLWVRDSLGPWLHAVAVRAARSARPERTRRRSRECGPIDRGPEPAVAAEPRDDLAAAVHEEVDRLPGRFRGPIVLCDLEGLTHEQAARRLGCPVGTVKSRLARGRARLRDRLIRRGLAPAAGLAAFGAAEGASAAVWPSLASSALAVSIGTTAKRGPAGVVSPAVAALAEGVLKSMIRANLRALGFPAAVAAAVVAGVVATGRGDAPDLPPLGVEPGPLAIPQDPDDGDGIATVEADATPVGLTIRGNIEAGHTAALEAPSETAVIEAVLPEGTRVREGQVVCELDASGLRAQHDRRESANEQIEAHLDRWEAELGRVEADETSYIDVLFPARERLAEVEVARRARVVTFAETELERLEASDFDASSIDRARLDLDRARFNRERAEGRLQILRDYTRPKRLTEFDRDRDRAREEVRVARARLRDGRSEAATLRERIDQFTIKVPFDGILVVAEGVERGTTVSPRQVVARVINLDGPMIASVHAPEAWVDRLVVGDRASVRIDAFPDQTVEGEVTEIAPVPDPDLYSQSRVKGYVTKVLLDERDLPLRPGMSAEAEILNDLQGGFPSVPVAAVVRDEAGAFLAVRTPDGGFAWRAVELGLANGERVKVLRGIEVGDRVAVDPDVVIDRIGKPH